MLFKLASVKEVFNSSGNQRIDMTDGFQWNVISLGAI